MDLFNKIKKLLISPKTVVSLILFILVACLIAFFIPQIADKSPSYFELWKENNIYTYRVVDRLQLNRVFTSYWFLPLVVVAAASLTYSLFLQVRKNLKKDIGHRSQLTKNGMQSTESSIISNRERVRIKEVFQKRRYHEKTAEGDGLRFVFKKNSIGRWGGAIFHLGLLIIIVSGIIVLCLQKRGFIQLMEGETFDGKEINFLSLEKGAFSGEFNTDFATSLQKFDHSYYESMKIRSLESSITVVRDGPEVFKKISANNPLFIENTGIYQSNDYGYTLTFLLQRPSGEKIMSHFNIDKAGNIAQPAEGISDYPATDYVFKMKLVPDISYRSYDLASPILYLTVLKKGDVVFHGLVIPGDAVKINEDVLNLMNLRLWSGLIFVYNPGTSLAYTGFAVAIFGAAILFMVPYKEIHLSFNPVNRESEISGFTNRFQALFYEEAEEIKKELKGVIKVSGEVG